MTITALFEGNTPSDLASAQSWASGAIGGVTIFTGQASWQDYTGSVGWEEGLWSGFAGTKLWSIPLIANGSSLHNAAQGSYDGYYADVAKTLADGQAAGPIYVRTGWEFNGSWEAWSAKGHEADYVGAFQQFVDTFRGVSNRFVFTWAPSIGDQGMNPAKAYPGDKYVDIIGEDFYWNTSWMSSDPGAAWSSMVHQTYGLQWLENFAAQHGKPTAYPEWGVQTANAAPYIADVAAWFASHNVVYQSYWDSNADFAGKLSDGGKPDAGAAYLAAFAPGASQHAVTATTATVAVATASTASSAASAGSATSAGATGVADTSHLMTTTGGAATLTGSVATAPVMTSSASVTATASPTAAGASTSPVATPSTSVATTPSTSVLTDAGVVGDDVVASKVWVGGVSLMGAGPDLA